MRRLLPTALLYLALCAGLPLTLHPQSEPTAASVPPRGYQARACGLDMNRNGVIGERADCRVCDGRTTDPDGDGIQEDLIYIDSRRGDDRKGKGTAASPYRSIRHAWSVADGGGDGAEDILCISGVFREADLSPPAGYSGAPGEYIVKARGSAERDWKFARNPAMIVGWDRDRDGQYPPYDKDDRAVLQSPGGKTHRAFHWLKNVARIELAHFTVRDYGYQSKVDGMGFMKWARNSEHDFMYIHDLELYRINGNRSGKTGGHPFTFDFFNTNVHWLNISNLIFEDNGGWFARGIPHHGSHGRPDMGPMRWQNVTRRTWAPNNESTPGFKLWGYVTGVEVLDSIWDANVKKWTPIKGTGWAPRGFQIVQCNQDWLIRNNEIIDMWNAVGIVGAKRGACENKVSRPTDNIRIDRNIIRNTFNEYGYGHSGISIKGSSPGHAEGDVATETVGRVSITNNMISSTGKNPWDACIASAAANDRARPPGPIRIIGNTCVGAIRRSTAGAILLGGSTDNQAMQKYPQNHYIVKNNIVAGLGKGDNNLVLGFQSRKFDIDHNVFDPAGNFVLRKGRKATAYKTLAEFRRAVGGNKHSLECRPNFTNPRTNNFHLSANDPCARRRGRSLERAFAFDIDFQRRSGLWDIGADQSIGGPNGPLPLPAPGGESGGQSGANNGGNNQTKPTPGNRPPAPGTRPSSKPTGKRPGLPPGFHPAKLDNVKLYVDSTFFENKDNVKRSVSFCNTRTCLKAADNKPVAQLYCDRAVFPHGCVRRWEDQSPYKPKKGFEPPEWLHGRDFGQDDIEKPGLIPNCINGRYCVRGGSKRLSPKRWKQNIALEVEHFNTPRITGDFSILLLARPVKQKQDYYYYGHGNHRGLTHRVKDDALVFQFGGFHDVTPLTGPGAVKNGQWHLIEVYRDKKNRIKIFVNGIDRTLGTPSHATFINMGYLLSKYKGSHNMEGDVAAFMVFDDLLTPREIKQTRAFIRRIYGVPR